MYAVRLSDITSQMRNCVIAIRGDWLFNGRPERDLWLKETLDIDVLSSNTHDEIIFKSEQDYLMFVLRWS